MRYFSTVTTLFAAGFLLITAIPPVAAQTHGSLDPDKALTNFLLDSWTTDEGLPQNTVNTILQTSDGYIWLGTQEGLVRFDGTYFHVFNERNKALNNNHVVALLEDSNCNLWVGTLGGGIALYSNGQFAGYTKKEGISSDLVTTILQDSSGSYWIGTADAGITRLTNDQISYLSTENGLGSNNVTALLEDRDGNIWIGTGGGGLTRYQDNKLTTFSTPNGLSSPDITSITQDRDGKLWIGTRGGGLISFHNDRFRALTTREGLPDNDVHSLFVDDAGSLWIGTNHGGLSRLFAGRFGHFSTSDDLSYDVVRTLYQDRTGSLWVGTDGSGLKRLRDGIVTTYTREEGLAHDFTYAIYEDMGGSLWIGTDAGVSRLQDDRFTTFTTHDGLNSDYVLSVYGTRDGSLWFGTYGAGLSRYKDGTFTSFSANDGLPGNEIYALFEDSKENLWMGTRSGLIQYRDGQFTTITADQGLSSNDVTSIAEDRDGRLWIGTYNGGLNVLDAGTIVQNYNTADGLLSNFILTMYADPEGDLWIGTREGGLIRHRDGVFTSYTPETGLFKGNIFQILEDHHGNLWMSSNVGLFRVSKTQLNDFAAGEIETVTAIKYDQYDGLRSSEFNGGFQPAGWCSRDGRLWFPSSEGIVAVNPANLPPSQDPPPIIIDRVLADGTAINTVGMVQLAPGTSELEFNFVSLTFLAPSKVQYMYLLDGFDEDWVSAGSRHEAYYANLRPGKYTFKVKAGDSEGNWSRQPATVSFYLKPFFYKRPLVRLLVSFCLVLMTFLLYRLLNSRLKPRRKELPDHGRQKMKTLPVEETIMEMTPEDTEEALLESGGWKTLAQQAVEEQTSQLREMDRIKTRFSDNISHEFRTPLTLMIGPLENALTGVYGSVDKRMKMQLELMLRNARRLLRLINQLLDLSKLEYGKLELNVQEYNIVPLLEGVLLSFTAFAEKKNLQLRFGTSEEEISLNFDVACIEKILYNLLSNAVKFTPEGGKIIVSVKETKVLLAGTRTAVEIRVKDTGIGIPEDDLPHIFDRFHQVDGSVSHAAEGTGIGLSLVQEMVGLHEGTIKVVSEPGKGSEFIVILPRGVERIQPTAITEPLHDSLARDISFGPMMEMAVFDDDRSPDDVFAGDPPELSDLNLERKIILVVDDNIDVLNYISESLCNDYNVITAGDGEEALEKVHEFLPDLIISDIMMPGMDGYSLCEKVKTHPKLKTIPIILLTAKATHEDKIRGLEAGADDYMPKPFHLREMSVRIRNLLTAREHRYEIEDLNEALTSENIGLQEVSEQKSEVLRIAAHDLKNPLNAIREFAQIIKKELGENSDIFSPAEIIQESSDQMLQMVSSLLDADAIESGLMSFNIKPININTLAAAVVRRNNNLAKKKGQELLLSVSEDRCLIAADRDRLFDAMDNLVSNAIKYSPMDKTILVNVRRDTSSIHFEVHDEGPGIREEDKEMLFKKFHRLSAQPTGGEGSSGLGLYIVKNIVDLHNGSVRVESEVGKGSTFVIALPVLIVDSMTSPDEEELAVETS